MECLMCSNQETRRCIPENPTVLIGWCSIASTHSYLCTWRTGLSGTSFCHVPNWNGNLTLSQAFLQSLRYTNCSIVHTLTIKPWQNRVLMILPLSNCFLILRISFDLPETLYSPSTSRPVRERQTAVIMAVSLSTSTVGMEMGVWGRHWRLSQQQSVLGSVVWHHVLLMQSLLYLPV